LWEESGSARDIRETALLIDQHCQRAGTKLFNPLA
jgi:hypothetical protein